MPTISLEKLRSLLSYDPETGDWTWIVDRPHTVKAGDRAGYCTPSGYWKINMSKAIYRAHRLAWLYMTGEQPPEMIDHIDGNPSNNRWANLRAATPAQNSANQRQQANNTSGYKGVYYSKHARKWRAQFSIDNKTKNLGYFDTPELAYEAYMKAARRRFGEFVRAA
jgi:hypothetical protein